MLPQALTRNLGTTKTVHRAHHPPRPEDVGLNHAAPHSQHPPYEEYKLKTQPSESRRFLPSEARHEWEAHMVFPPERAKDENQHTNRSAITIQIRTYIGSVFSHTRNSLGDVSNDSLLAPHVHSICCASSPSPPTDLSRERHHYKHTLSVL